MSSTHQNMKSSNILLAVWNTKASHSHKNKGPSSFSESKIPPIHQDSRFQLCFIFSPDFKKGHTFSDAKLQTFSPLPKRNISPLFFPHLNSTSLTTIISSNIGICWRRRNHKHVLIDRWNGSLLSYRSLIDAFEEVGFFRSVVGILDLSYEKRLSGW
jgi:hypothetical protein